MITQRSLDIENYVTMRTNSAEEAQHAIRVAQTVRVKYSDEYYYQVALLHDIVEDGYSTISKLKEMFDLNEPQVVALDFITRREGERYFDYIHRVKNNSMAKAIKLADLKDNIHRCTKDLDNRWGLLRRYAKAYAILIGQWENR